MPIEEKTAINGKWVKGPGAFFFNFLKTKIDNLPIIAEDLGVGGHKPSASAFV